MSQDRSLAAVRGSGRLALGLPRPFWLVAAISWAAGIWWLSSQTSESYEVSYLWAWISNMAHAPLYGLLALWLALALPREDTALGYRWTRFGLLDFRIVFWTVVFYGIVDEFHQSTVFGRDASVFDLFTDGTAAYVTLGVAAAAGRPGLVPGEMARRLAKGVLACCLTGLAATFA